MPRWEKGPGGLTSDQLQVNLLSHSIAAERLSPLLWRLARLIIPWLCGRAASTGLGLTLAGPALPHPPTHLPAPLHVCRAAPHACGKRAWPQRPGSPFARPPVLTRVVDPRPLALAPVACCSTHGSLERCVCPLATPTRAGRATTDRAAEPRRSIGLRAVTPPPWPFWPAEKPC